MRHVSPLGGIVKQRVKDWVEHMDGNSLVLQTPAGEVTCCSGRAGYRAAVERGDIALSPLEIVALLRAREEGRDLLAGVDGARHEGAAGSILALVVATKQADPGARVRAVWEDDDEEEAP
jgi:hypothetical protein